MQPLRAARRAFFNDMFGSCSCCSCHSYQQKQEHCFYLHSDCCGCCCTLSSFARLCAAQVFIEYAIFAVVSVQGLLLLLQDAAMCYTMWRAALHCVYSTAIRMLYTPRVKLDRVGFANEPVSSAFAVA